MEKIIFLDFDGVVRLPVLGGDRLEAEFSSEHVGRVVELVQSSQALVVIASDWRLRRSLAEIISELGSNFPSSQIHPDWATPDLSSGQERLPRGREIGAWLAAHPEVTTFIILDDLSPSHFGEFAPRLVRSNLESGFTGEHLERAMRLLTE